MADKMSKADVNNWHDFVDRYKGIADLNSVVSLWCGIEGCSNRSGVLKTIMTALDGQVDSSCVAFKDNQPSNVFYIPSSESIESDKRLYEWFTKYRDGIHCLNRYHDAQNNIGDEETSSDLSDYDSDLLRYRFISLGMLFEKLDSRGHDYPSQLKREYDSLEVPLISTLPDWKLSEDSPFPLLQIAPKLIKYLSDNSEIQTLIETSKSPYKTFKTKVIRSLGYEPSSEEGKEYSFLLAVLLPKELRYEAKADLRLEIDNAINLIWSSKGINDFWLPKGMKPDDRVNEIREMIITNQGDCSENEAEFLLKFISPRNLTGNEEIDQLNIWRNELENLKMDLPN